MKIGDYEATPVSKLEPVIFSRGIGEDGKEIFLVFIAEPIKDFEEFEALCPRPKPGGLMTPQGWQDGIDVESDVYKDQAVQWARQRSRYIFIKSLEPSRIKWDKVQLSKPDTWVNIDDELKGILGYFEFLAVKNLVNEANSLDQDKLEAAKERFFRQRAKVTE